MKARLFFIAIVLLCLFAACQLAGNQEQEPPVTTIVKNVERVLMHEPGDYTFFYANPQNPKELLSLGIARIHKLKIFQDVPAGDGSWLTVVSRRKCEYSCYDVESLEIHLRSAEEINGAGWGITANGVAVKR